MLAADAIQPRDDLADAGAFVPVPHAELVLLRIAVLLASVADRARFAELERGPVDPVARAERRGQRQPGDERRTAAVLELLREYVRCVRPQIRAKVLAHVRLCE